MPLKIHSTCSWDAIWVKKWNVWNLYYHEVLTCEQSTGYVWLCYVQVKDAKYYFRYDHWDKLHQVKVVWDTLQYLYNENTHQNEIQWLF